MVNVVHYTIIYPYYSLHHFLLASCQVIYRCPVTWKPNNKSILTVKRTNKYKLLYIKKTLLYTTTLIFVIFWSFSFYYFDVRMTTDKKKLKRNMTVFELLTVPGHGVRDANFFNFSVVYFCRPLFVLLSCYLCVFNCLSLFASVRYTLWIFFAWVRVIIRLNELISWIT